jgi:hypothetical protein
MGGGPSLEKEVHNSTRGRPPLLFFVRSHVKPEPRWLTRLIERLDGKRRGKEQVTLKSGEPGKRLERLFSTEPSHKSAVL